MVQAGSPTLPAGGQVLDANSLTVSGILDLTDDDLIVNTPSSAAMITLQEQVGFGVNDAAGTQGTIISSIPTTLHGMTIGVAPVVDTGIYVARGTSVLDGQTVPETALVARYTEQGDATLIGNVDLGDGPILNTNYQHNLGTNPPQWYNGDFTYIGQVTLGDFISFNNNFQTQCVANPVDVTVGTPYTLDLPAATPTGTAIDLWYINWGDGDFDSYSPNSSLTSASHTYISTLDAGAGEIQMTGICADGTVYRVPATPIAVTAATGLTAVNLTASSSTDAFNISADTSGDTIITDNGTVIDTILTADLLSISITGDGDGTTTVNFANGDPLPPSGLSIDSGQLDVIGSTASDTLLTTGTAAVFGNSLISGAEIR